MKIPEKLTGEDFLKNKVYADDISMVVDKINEIISYLSEHPVRKEGEK